MRTVQASAGGERRHSARAQHVPPRPQSLDKGAKRQEKPVVDLEKKNRKAEHSHLNKGAPKQQLFLTESSRFHLGTKGVHLLGWSSVHLLSQTLPGADHASSQAGVVLPETRLL